MDNGRCSKIDPGKNIFPPDIIMLNGMVKYFTVARESVSVELCY